MFLRSSEFDGSALFERGRRNGGGDDRIGHCQERRSLADDPTGCRAALRRHQQLPGRNRCQATEDNPSFTWRRETVVSISVSGGDISEDHRSPKRCEHDSDEHARRYLISEGQRPSELLWSALRCLRCLRIIAMELKPPGSEYAVRPIQKLLCGIQPSRRKRGRSGQAEDID